MLANTVRDAKKRAKPFEPEDFHPLRSTAPPPRTSIHALKAVFVDGRVPTKPQA